MARNRMTPLRRPWSVLSKTAFVISLKPEVRAPDAAKPAKNDCKLRAKGLVHWFIIYKIAEKVETN